MFQDEGPFWHIEVIYTVNTLDGIDYESGSEDGPGHSELTVRSMSNPIENHPNYRKKWNYNLYYLGAYPSESDYIYAWNNATAENEMIAVGGTYTGPTNFNPANTYYCWGKGVADCGSAPDGYVWVKLKNMTKPGIETYDYPVYEMTQYGKHKNKSQAGWAVSSKIGKTATPSKGDFGIDSKLAGNWLCEGGQVRHNGKYWVSALTYVFSGNGKNWDDDIYPSAN